MPSGPIPSRGNVLKLLMFIMGMRRKYNDLLKECMTNSDEYFFLHRPIIYYSWHILHARKVSHFMHVL